MPTGPTCSIMAAVKGLMRYKSVKETPYSSPQGAKAISVITTPMSPTCSEAPEAGSTFHNTPFSSPTMKTPACSGQTTNKLTASVINQDNRRMTRPPYYSVGQEQPRTDTCQLTLERRKNKMTAFSYTAASTLNQCFTTVSSKIMRQ